MDLARRGQTIERPIDLTKSLDRGRSDDGRGPGDRVGGRPNRSQLPQTKVAAISVFIVGAS